jgi:hypothetical protein
MSRKRRPPISRDRKVTRCKLGRIEKTSVRERTVPRDGAEFSEFLRSRDPQVMGPLMLALNKSRTLFSWLTPGTRVIGVPGWAGQDLPWLTLIDDLHAEAAGPTSFDQRSLEWWTNHAVALIVDAAKALPNFTNSWDRQWQTENGSCWSRQSRFDGSSGTNIFDVRAHRASRPS